MSTKTSTVEYFSNIQPINTKVIVDSHFLSFVHDPFALDMMNTMINQGRLEYHMSVIQQKEMTDASKHCFYAFKDDYPWGTINYNGEKRVVCKCINTSCIHFNQCREGISAFDESELLLGQHGNSIITMTTEKQKNIDEGINFRKSLEKNKFVVLSKQSDVGKTILGSNSSIVDLEDTTQDSIVENEQENNDIPDVEIKKLDFSGEGFEKFVEVDQERVICSTTDKRLVINAGPGTGKTWALIEKLIYMVRNLEVDPEEILVLCFSRAAVEVIEKRLQSAYKEGKIGPNWNSIEIRTFDSFATRLLSYIIKNEPGLLYAGFTLEKLDYDERISIATNVISKDNGLIEQCSHLIVDEVQDLVSLRARFVMQIIKALPEKSGFTLLGDACQSIYDYQIADNEINSTRFYRWIFNSLCNAEFYSFSTNYRQTTELADIGNSYRTAILTGDSKDRMNVGNTIFNNVEEIVDIKLKDMEYKDLRNCFRNGSIGILTRTNGQALRISTWFRNSEIPHKVQRRLSDNNLASWIGEVFIGYKNDTIDENEFKERIQEMCGFDAEKSDLYWQAIEKTQYNSKTRYRICDLLSGIKDNAKEKELYTGTNNCEVVISNIHRSKGREFDNVILLDDILHMEYKKKKDIQEHKVCYVAITRAKDKIYRTDMGKQYKFISIDKVGERRSFLTGFAPRGKKSRLSNIEIGRKYDIDLITFAESKETQKLICEKYDIVGQRVRFIRNKNVKEYVCYDVILEEIQGYNLIGRTSKKFSDDLIRIMKKTLGLYGDCMPEYYPSEFSDIYVDEKITIISNYNSSLKGAYKFGDNMIWQGVTLIGFAKTEFYRY